MAVLTLGDVKQQCIDIAGPRTTDAIAIRAIVAAINTVNTSIQLEAMALGLNWMHRRDVILDYTSTTTSIILPDGLTVLDHAGSIPVACHIVKRVQMVDTGQVLTSRPRTLVEQEYGGLDIIGRGAPCFWDQSGINAAGQYLLWIMPYPSGSGQIAIDYLGGLRPLVSDAQVLAVPIDFREVVAQKAIAKIMGTVSIDPVIRRECKEEAERMWNNIVASALGGSPEFQGMTLIQGQTQ